jgi:tetratricopeptide (TPR) repeat protein
MTWFGKAIWKRQISVYRRMGKVEKAVEELSQFLDTFYTDVEGWLELADIYSTCNQSVSSIPTIQTFTIIITNHYTFYRYTSALQSLSHVLLLTPQNPFYVLQAAETAYTAGDIPLSIRMFLMAVDMTDADDSVALADSTPTGITVRAWYGVKLVSSLLICSTRYSSLRYASVLVCTSAFERHSVVELVGISNTCTPKLKPHRRACDRAVTCRLFERWEERGNCSRTG